MSVSVSKAQSIPQAQACLISKRPGTARTRAHPYWCRILGHALQRSLCSRRPGWPPCSQARKMSSKVLCWPEPIYLAWGAVSACSTEVSVEDFLAGVATCKRLVIFSGSGLSASSGTSFAEALSSALATQLQQDP